MGCQNVLDVCRRSDGKVLGSSEESVFLCKLPNDCGNWFDIASNSLESAAEKS